MATWQDVKDKVMAFRNYVAGLTPAGQAAAKYSFMITKDDIKSMLDQAGGPQQLDGLRAYIGADTVDGKMVPCIYFVAVQIDAQGNYNDYLLNGTLPSGAMPLLGKTLPCPTWCPKSNFLNP